MKYLFQFRKQKRDETRIEKWRCQDVNVVNARTFLSIEILDDANTVYRLFKIRKSNQVVFRKWTIRMDTVECLPG